MKGMAYRLYNYPAVYMDFTGQVHKLKEDVYEFLLKHKIKSPFVFAVTFSKRVSKGPKTAGLYTFIDEYKQFESKLTDIMKMKQMTPVYTDVDQYSGNGVDREKRQTMFTKLYVFKSMNES